VQEKGTTCKGIDEIIERGNVGEGEYGYCWGEKREDDEERILHGGYEA